MLRGRPAVGLGAGGGGGAPGESAWVAGPSMTTARGSFGLAAVGDKMYAVGGYNGRVIFASVEVLDTSADAPAWRAGPKMATGRVDLGLAAVGAKLYAVGGFNAFKSPSPFASIEVLDTSADAPVWTAGPKMAVLVGLGLGVVAVAVNLMYPGEPYSYSAGSYINEKGENISKAKAKKREYARKGSGREQKEEQKTKKPEKAKRTTTMKGKKSQRSKKLKQGAQRQEEGEEGKVAAVREGHLDLHAGRGRDQPVRADD